MRMLVGVTAALLIAADPPKSGENTRVPKEVQGVWVATFGANGKSYMTNSRGSGKLTFGDGTAEWAAIEDYIKAGKGTIRVDPAAKPHTIELKSGETIYKGIYQPGSKGTKDKPQVDPDALDIILSAPGGEAPKAFPANPISLPKGYKGVRLHLMRKK